MFRAILRTSLPAIVGAGGYFATQNYSRSAEAAGIDYKKVKSDIIAAIEAEEEKRGDGTSIAPTLVRLAWHAAGTYSIFDRTGGSNGATMRFSPEAGWGANAGLKGARDFLEPLKKKYGITYADLWTLAGGKLFSNRLFLFDLPCS